jgi:large subunit ribosomal protein L6
MSRIGKKPIAIPEGVTVTIDGNHVTVKGPKGTLERDINPAVTAKVENNEVIVSIDNEENGNLHGLTRTLIHNMIEGTEKEFTRTLQINGVGYRAQKQGTNLVMNLGYSHQVIMEAPEGITYDVPDANTIIVRGISKELVGQTAAVVRSKRPPEVYKGKGIKYAEEHIRRKEGKTGKK